MTNLSGLDPWYEALKVYRYLSSYSENKTPPLWEHVWRDVVSLLITTYEVLKHDKKHSEAHRYSIDDFRSFLYHRRDENAIYWEFLKNERNRVHHEFLSSAFETRYTQSNYSDGGLACDQLCAKYSEYISIDWSESGQCGFNLLRVALKWWEVNLRGYGTGNQGWRTKTVLTRLPDVQATVG